MDLKRRLNANPRTLGRSRSLSRGGIDFSEGASIRSFLSKRVVIRQFVFFDRTAHRMTALRSLRISRRPSTYLIAVKRIELLSPPVTGLICEQRRRKKKKRSRGTHTRARTRVKRNNVGTETRDARKGYINQDIHRNCKRQKQKKSRYTII